MRIERQRMFLRQLEDSVGAPQRLFGTHSRVQPAAAYTDPDRYAAELRDLFRAGPALVGLSTEVATPGSYLTADLGGVPIAVVRQADGSLRALVNACRHRGAPLLDGRGDGLRRMTCGYHAWTYRPDGSLHSRPLTDGAFDDVGLDCNLHHVAVAERYGLILARPGSTEPIDVDAFLSGAQDDLAAYRLDRCAHVETRTTTWRMNWKLVLDTFTESYHIRTLHRESIAPAFQSGCTLWEPFGPHLLNIGYRTSVFDELTRPEDERSLLPHATAQYFLLPNAMLCHQVDHIELWRLEPVDVHTTIVSTSVFAASLEVSERTDRYLRRNLDLLLDVTGREDFPLMERIQSTLDAGALTEMVHGRIEPALVHFHESVDRLLAEGRLPG